jgi:hypothetical protein
MRIPDIRGAQGTMQANQVVSQPNLLQGVSEGLGGFAQLQAQKEERDARESVVSKSTDLHLGSIKALQEAQMEAKEPSEIGSLFAKKYGDLTNNISGELSNDKARELFTEQADRYRTTFGAKALEMEFSQTIQKRKDTLDRVNNDYTTNIITGGEFDLNLEGGLDAWNQYRDAGLINEVGYTEGVREFKRNAAKGRVDYLLGNAQYAEAETLLQDKSFTSMLDSNDVSAIQDKIVTGKEKFKGLIMEDPIDAYDTLNGKPDSIEPYIKMQEAMGIDPSKAKVLSKDETMMLSQQFNGIGSANQFTMTLDSIKQKYGDKAPNAIRQLVDAKKIDSSMAYALQMNPVTDAQAMELIFEFKGKPIADLEKEVKARNETISSFKTELNSTISEDIQVINSSTGADPSFLREQSQRLAYSYMIKNNSTSKEAINFAANTLRGGNAYVPFNDNKFLMSTYKYTQNEIDLVTDALPEYTKTLESTIDVKAQNERISDIVEKGLVKNKDIMWVSNYDGTGLALKTNTGIALMDKDNKPIEVKFSELVKQGQKKADWLNKYYDIPYAEREAMREKQFPQIKQDNKALAEKMSKPVGAK